MRAGLAARNQLLAQETLEKEMHAYVFGSALLLLEIYILSAALLEILIQMQSSKTTSSRVFSWKPSESQPALHFISSPTDRVS